MNTEGLPKSLLEEAKAWRHQFHANPELGFEEVQTAGMVASILAGLGIEVHEGIAGTGVVGVLKKRKWQQKPCHSGRYGCTTHARAESECSLLNQSRKNARLWS